MPACGRNNLSQMPFSLSCLPAHAPRSSRLRLSFQFLFSSRCYPWHHHCLCPVSCNDSFSSFTRDYSVSPGMPVCSNFGLVVCVSESDAVAAAGGGHRDRGDSREERPPGGRRRRFPPSFASCLSLSLSFSYQGV